MLNFRDSGLVNSDKCWVSTMSPAVSTIGLSRLCAASTTVKNSLTLALAGTSELGGLRIVVTHPGKTPEVQSAVCS